MKNNFFDVTLNFLKKTTSKIIYWFYYNLFLRFTLNNKIKYLNNLRNDGRKEKNKQ